MWYYLSQNRKPKNGVLFGGFLVIVFLSRLIIENWKEVQEAWEAAMVLNMGQILSLPFILLGVVILILAFAGKTGKIVDIESLKLKSDTKKK
jgi:prolipoprotein diacylglyceryltransferase